MDAEMLVEKAWKLHHDSISYTHCPRHSEGDKAGKDFCNVRFNGYDFCIDVQVKTSDNRETIGVVLPLDEPLPPEIEKRLSPGMKEKMREHSRKHPHVHVLIFVARTGTYAEEMEAIRDIWKETQGVLPEYRKKHVRRDSNGRHLANFRRM